MIGPAISRIIIFLFGNLYPAYSSYKAIRSRDVREYVKWMMYWIVFAFFTCIETCTDIFLSWFPLYYEWKAIIVFFLLSPATNGSSWLYRKFVHPELTRREQDIDEYINQAKERGYSMIVELASKGVSYASNVILQTAIKTVQYSLNSIYASETLSLKAVPAEIYNQPKKANQVEDFDMVENHNIACSNQVDALNIKLSGGPEVQTSAYINDVFKDELVADRLPEPFIRKYMETTDLEIEAE